jgi:hypothetical protein
MAINERNAYRILVEKLCKRQSFGKAKEDKIKITVIEVSVWGCK